MRINLGLGQFGFWLFAIVAVLVGAALIILFLPIILVLLAALLVFLFIRSLMP